VLGCTLAIVLISSDELAFGVFEDNLDYAALHNLHVPFESEESSDDEDFEIPPPPKCSKKIWHTNFRWSGLPSVLRLRWF